MLVYAHRPAPKRSRSPPFRQALAPWQRSGLRVRTWRDRRAYPLAATWVHTRREAHDVRPAFGEQMAHDRLGRAQDATEINRHHAALGLRQYLPEVARFLFPSVCWVPIACWPWARTLSAERCDQRGASSRCGSPRVYPLAPAGNPLTCSRG